MNKVLFITGGTRGISKQIIKQFVNNDIEMIINYRSNEEEAEKWKVELSQMTTNPLHFFKCDVSDVLSCNEMMQEVTAIVENKQIIWIHNVGPYISERKHFIDYTEEEWDRLMNGNTKSFFLLAKHLIPLMRKQKWGRIITFGFERSETAPAWKYRSVFAAAKTALVTLTRTIALEEAEYGITANMIEPGDIRGEWKEKAINEALDTATDHNPVGRYGTGEDIGRVVAFLCDERSDFITGAIIPVTGGKDVLTKWKS